MSVETSDAIVIYATARDVTRRAPEVWGSTCKHCGDEHRVHAGPDERCLVGATRYYSTTWADVHAPAAHAIGDKVKAYLGRTDARDRALGDVRELLQEVGALVTPPPTDETMNAYYGVTLETSHGMVQAGGHWSPTSRKWRLSLTEREKNT